MLDQDLGLSERAKYLTIETFVAEPGIEALAVSILPRRYGLDVGGFGTDSSDPVLTFWAMNSGPLSDLMNSGGSRKTNRSVRASTMSVELSLQSTQSISASLVKSSMMLSVR